jgi:hypothetical protein
MARSRGYRGGAHGQRTDLNQKLPVATAPGQQYGQATAQAQAQQVVPMAPGPPMQIAAAAQQAASPAALPQTGAGTSDIAAPGSFPPLHAETDRPNEPVTHGAAAGAGAGPEALMGFQPSKLSQTIAQIAQASGNSDLLRLAQQALSQGN